MEMLEYLLMVLTPTNLLWLTIGSIVGAFLGALPGMNADTGIAMFLPLTFNMDPLTGLLTLCAIYTSASYGGNITGVLLNTPGTPEAMYMAWDGYPMTERGEGAKAIGVTTIAAFFAGVVGALALLFLSPFIARFALKFGPMEMFLTTLLGLTIVIGLSKGSMLKGCLSACLGLLCALIGTDDFIGVSRFDFGMKELYDGLPLLPTVLGLFAVSQLLVMVAENKGTVACNNSVAGSPFLSLVEMGKLAWVTIRSSIIGTIVGIIPAASTSVAVGISYGLSKREDKDPDSYGSGNPKGLATASAAHSAITGGSLVPLLTLAIPGNATAALFLGGLTIHGLAPGTKLFTTDGHIVYPMMIGLVLAQFYILFIGLFGAKQFCKVTNVPNSVLIPIVGCLSVLGAYVFRYQNFDMVLVLICGLVGYYMVSTGISPAPFVLAFVLGGRVETSWRRMATLTGGGGSFMDMMLKPVPMILLALNVLFLISPFWNDIKGALKKRTLEVQ